MVRQGRGPEQMDTVPLVFRLPVEGKEHNVAAD